MRFLLTPCFVALFSVTIGHAANLVSNPSFEALNAGSWSTQGWFVDGSAKGTVTRTSPGFHGEAAARITSESPMAPNVFIRFGQRLAVKPDTDYVISLYVRSEGVGYAWFGGGPDWALRTRIPQDTGGQWQRLSATFNSGDADAWVLMVVVEHVTTALDVDAVEVEEGTAPTAFGGEPFRAMIRQEAFAGIYADPGAFAARLEVVEFRGAEMTGAATWSLRRLPDGPELTRGEEALRVGPRQACSLALPFPADAPFGLYEYMATVRSGGDEQRCEARAAIMREPPADRELDTLGFSIHVVHPYSARLLRRLGLRWARMDWNWSLFEKAPGQVNFGFQEYMLGIAEQYGLKLLPVLAYTPEWALQPDGTFRPEDHASYVGRVLAHFRGELPAINVWNEPEGDGPISVAKNPGLWEQDLKAVHAAARAADPDCKIVGLALSANPGDPGGWFSTILEAPLALGQYLDAYDWHSYVAPRNRRPEERGLVGSVDDLPQWLPRIGPLVAGGEVWITEHGFTTCDPQPESSALAPFHVTEKEQGDYLVRQVLLELAYGIDRVFLYQLGPDGTGRGVEEQWGITRERPDGYSAKVAYVQLANMVWEIAGAQPGAVEIPDPNVRVVHFRRGGTDVVAVWAVRGTAPVRFRLREGYVGDPFGNRTPAGDILSLQATESPVFVVGQDVAFIGETG